MTAMMRELEHRRRALVIRSALERARISAQLQPTARGLAAVDRVVATLRAHPVATGVALSGLAIFGPRKLFRWAIRIAPFYSLFARI
jgi:hypothetical protein